MGHPNAWINDTGCRFGFGVFEFVDFAPEEFATLRHLFGLDDAEYAESIQQSTIQNGLRMQAPTY